MRGSEDPSTGLAMQPKPTRSTPLQGLDHPGASRPRYAGSRAIRRRDDMDPAQRPQPQHILEPTGGLVAALAAPDLEGLQEEDDGRTGLTSQQATPGLVRQPGQEFLGVFRPLGKPHQCMGQGFDDSQFAARRVDSRQLDLRRAAAEGDRHSDRPQQLRLARLRPSNDEQVRSPRMVEVRPDGPSLLIGAEERRQ
jgi:hypothetical protein